MDARSLFLLGIAPIILLLNYIKKKDPHPEPKDLLKKVFIFGCIIAIPVVICEFLYSALFIPAGSDATSFSDVFFGVALIEEFFKWIVVYFLCFKSIHFDESYDAIVYSAYSSLAFACIENLGYIFLNGGLITGIVRAFTAVPGHLCNSIIMGYFIGQARAAKAKGKSAFLRLFCSLLLPSLVHCIYDYLLGIGEILLWIPYFIAVVVVCIFIVRHAAKNNTLFSDSTPQLN